MERKEQNFRKNSIVNEILRFCRALTLYRYDAEEDRMFKDLISENLKNIDINLSEIMLPTTKKGCIQELLRSSAILTQCEYGTEVDTDIKKQISELLSKLSTFEKAEREIKQNRQQNDLTAKILRCVT